MRVPVSPSSVCFIYKIGHSLYIPLTSFCNTKTLPESRGPAFFLPPNVVEPLLHVRRAEQERCDVSNVTHNHPSTLQTLPPTNNLYKVNSLYSATTIDFASILPCIEDDDGRFPSVFTLFHQVESQMNNADDTSIQSLVFGGEGEPTLRLPAIVSLSRLIRNKWEEDHSTITLPIRLLTNGLTQTLPDFASINILETLKHCGVTHLTITLPTACPDQYIELMDPILLKGLGSIKDEHRKQGALKSVCTFIEQAIQQGFQVEVTGVHRPDVDTKQVEVLARKLGVTAPFRWRSYHP